MANNIIVKCYCICKHIYMMCRKPAEGEGIPSRGESSEATQTTQEIPP